jgi:thiosulfate dehydrogenase (quinone) large subunit
MTIAKTLYRQSPVTTPGIANWLMADPRSGWIWFAIRMYVGWEWFTAGREKLWPAAGPSWITSGNALKAYWARAVAVPPTGSPPVIYGWYRVLLKFMLNHDWYPWFAKLISLGELAVGVALIFGAFVGIAAFFGTVMNFSYLLAGSASSNPVLFGMSVFLILAWRVSGLIGLDRFLLPTVQTPWAWAERFWGPSRE